ncbi:MAG: hypothetical protein ABIH64_02565, partial [Nanoarchaeota archaeon]
AVYKRNKDNILICLTFVLAITTLASIVSMNNLGEIEERLINATEEIGKIQIYLAKDMEKKETLEQIDLTGELMGELLHNQNELLEVILSLPSLKNRTESMDDDFRTTKVETAISRVNFGSLIMGLTLPSYLEAINKIKDDLREIGLSQSHGQISIKRERIDRAVTIAKQLFYGSYKSDLAITIKSDDVWNATRDYYDERLTHYTQIDQKTEEELGKLG